MFVSGLDGIPIIKKRKAVTKPERQIFSIPSGIIHYLTHTPSSPKGYQKLLKTCKYFVFKKYIFVVDDLNMYDNVQKYWESYTVVKEIDAFSDNLPYKFWLTKSLRFFYYTPPKDILLRFSKNIYKYNLVKLQVKNQILTYSEYLKLTESGSIEHFSFYEGIVKYEDGKMVPFEILAETLPNIVELTCSYFGTPYSAFTPATFKILKQLLFKNLKRVQICDKRPLFDAKDFCDFIFRNHASFYLDFKHPVPDEWYNIIKNYFSFKSSSTFQIRKYHCDRTPFFLLPTRYENWTVISIKLLN